MALIQTTLQSLYPLKRGPGYWKFNNKLLEEKEFVTLIKDEIKEITQLNSQADDITLWDTIKMHL